jgi:hypothetical protein
MSNDKTESHSSRIENLGLEERLLKFENYTPHAIDVYDDNNNIIKSFPPSGKNARMSSQEQVNLFYIEGVLVKSAQVMKKLDLPSPNSDTNAILVSLPIGQYFQGVGHDEYKNLEIYGPDTDVGAVRNEKGTIKGTKNLVCYRH